jgi:hypothetical protein
LVGLQLKIKISIKGEDSLTEDIIASVNGDIKSIESPEKISQGKKDFNTDVSESIGPGDYETKFVPKSNVDRKEDGPIHHDVTSEPKKLSPEQAGQSHPHSSNATASCKDVESEIEGQWVFLDTVPDFMKCRICNCVFESPQLLSCCGTNICKKCSYGSPPPTTCNAGRPATILPFLPQYGL